jgi:SRSO17 transposase
MQMYLKDSPFDDTIMKHKYQSRVLTTTGDPNGMLTIDSSEHIKKGYNSAGVARQYCGRLGKVENCQSGVYVGYSRNDSYGLLDASLYLPEAWFDEEHKALWEPCDIPKTTTFKTKSQLALDMISEIEKNHGIQFKWVGCDSAFGCNTEFRKSLPESVYFFADIRSNQRIFLQRPAWSVPERKSRHGKVPSKPVPSILSVPVSSIVADASLPWKEITLMDGAKGQVRAFVKCCRVIEIADGKDSEELWLYIRRYENGQIKYSFSNAPADTDVLSLHQAATLRWPIEQCFQECKSHLGMSDYETRSYKAWSRHMLLVMIAYLFVLEVRKLFLKKQTPAPLAQS